MVLSFALNRTEVGYQPVGMKPIGRAFLGSATLSTAMLLASALATKSTSPSGVRARLLGVLPLGAPGYRAQWMVCNPLPVAVSSTLTFVELAQATKSASPLGESTISVGCSAVGHVCTTAFFSRSMTATAARAHSETKARLPPGSARHVYG